MTASPMMRYQQNDVTGMPAPRRVVLLYAHILTSIRHARRAIDQRDFAARSSHLSRAREIINELAVSLDRQAGGAIAANLAQLYEYFLWEILQVDLRNDGARLDRLTELVTMLHEAWDQAAREVTSLPAPAASVANG